jgi:hypothetical protein
MKIFKYTIPVTDEPSVEMHKGAQIIHVDEKPAQPGSNIFGGDNHLCIWAVVDPSEPLIQHRFVIFGTGNPIDGYEGEDLYHIGTVLMRNGLVWHVFDRDFSTGEDIPA